MWILKLKAPNLEVTWPEEQGKDICHRVDTGVYLPALGDHKWVFGAPLSVCV